MTVKVKTMLRRGALSFMLALASLSLSGSAVVTSQSRGGGIKPPTVSAPRPAPPPPPPPPNQTAATTPAVRETLAAESLGGRSLPFRILLPADYSTSSRRYPVLYLLHGLTGDENDWPMRSRIKEYAARYRLIVVMPGVGDTWYANSATDPASRYEDVIVKDLVGYVDSHYRTIAAREGRAVAGLSMGGLGAVKFALLYPHMFAFAGSFSGAFDVPLTASLGKNPSARMLRDLRRVFGGEGSRTRRENDVFTLLKQPPPEGTTFPYLYVSTGKSDPLPQVSDSNPRLDRALRAGGLRYEYHERPGTHDWRFWDSEIEFMLGRLCVVMPVVCS